MNGQRSAPARERESLEGLIMAAKHAIGTLVIAGALCFACAPPEAGKSVSKASPKQGVRAIEGRVVDLDVIATRATEVNSGVMTLITAQGDTLLLCTPAVVRCKGGAPGDDVGIGLGTTL